MSHREQLEFVGEVRNKYPKFFRGTRVLEVGSLNVNGSVRSFFKHLIEYIGIDCHTGRDVDVVCLAHEYVNFKPFDVVISCECFEHDPFWEKSIPHVIKMLRPGGLFLATWASPNRKEHGTTRTQAADQPFVGPDPEYYRGLSVLDVRGVIGDLLMGLDIRDARHNLDVFCVGFRATGNATV